MISYISVIGYIDIMYGFLLETIILVTRIRFQLESCMIYGSFLLTIWNNRDCFHFKLLFKC